MAAPSRAERIAHVGLAHAALVEHLDAMAADGAVPGAASTLPGWTRGHLLTHVARNADSFVRILQGVERGERLDQYEGGPPARAAAIDAGAARSWADLVDDVRASATALDDQLGSQRRWDGGGVGSGGGALAAEEIPFRRLREVLVHHADLGDARYTAEDWPALYVREELRLLTMRWTARLPMGGPALPAPVLEEPPIRRLLWLMGRVEIPGVEPAGVF